MNNVGPVLDQLPRFILLSLVCLTLVFNKSLHFQFFYLVFRKFWKLVFFFVKNGLLNKSSFFTKSGLFLVSFFLILVSFSYQQHWYCSFCIFSPSEVWHFYPFSVKNGWTGIFLKRVNHFCTAGVIKGYLICWLYILP